MGENKKYLHIACIGILLIIFTVFMTGNRAQTTEMQNGTVNKHKVALITKGTTSSFWQSVYSGANAASTAYNMELVFDGPENEEDYQSQNKLIKKAVEDGAEALVFSAVDYNANAEVIDEAAGKNVKIIVIDSDVNSTMVSSRIGTDNYQAGEMAARAALECKDQELKIGIVNFDKKTQNGQEREQGFREYALQDQRAEIVETINVNSTSADAKKGAKDLLSRHPEINVVVTFNEFTSLGVGYAIREMKLSDDVMVVAFDNHVVSVGMLETGEVDALIVQNPFAMGYLGVETAYKLLNGTSLVQDRIDTETVLVKQENMYDEDCQRVLFAFNQSD